LAIGDDPNNAAGFVAAGWAAIGLGRGNRARELFLEAAEASDGDERDTALRQAARITFALEDHARQRAWLELRTACVSYRAREISLALGALLVVVDLLLS
jgi:hypothetical protein